MTTNGTVSPIRPNWADTAKPFMRDMVEKLTQTTTLDDIATALRNQPRPVTPKEFLVDSCMNVLITMSGQNWALHLFREKIRAQALKDADELADLYGGYEPAILGLLQQDLATLSAALK